jgi:histidine triad (HIT) family protein
MAFMDLMPQTPGHTLIIPHTPAAEIFELPADDLAQVITLTQRIAKAVRLVFEPPGVMIVQLNGALAGQTVFHLHFHVIPRFEGLDMKMHARVVEHPDVLDGHAERLHEALQQIP